MAYFRQTKFAGALVLDCIFPKKIRGVLAGLFTFLIVLSGGSLGYVLLGPRLESMGIAGLPVVPLTPSSILGVLLFSLGVRLFCFALHSFYLGSTYDYAGEASAENVLVRLTYPAADIWYRASSSIFGMNRATAEAITQALPASKFGRDFLLRLGITPTEFRTALAGSRQAGGVAADNAETGIESYMRQKKYAAQEITLADILLFLFGADESFRSLLLARQIREDDLAGAALWIERVAVAENERVRWWSRDNLGRIPGIGKSWSFGYTVFLQQFTEPLQVTPEQQRGLVGRKREIELLESALLKTAGANVMIVGEPGIGKRTILHGLSQMISEGRIFPDLEHKQVLELSVAKVLGAGKTKGETEALLLRILTEAATAKNIIFAVADFPEFVESLQNLGITPGTLLDPYLATPRLHVVGLGTPASFQRVREREKGLVSDFTIVELTAPSRADLTAIIEDAVPVAERSSRRNVIVTYPAIAAIVDGVEQYLLSGGGAPERAINLLDEVAHESANRRAPFCTRELVLEHLGKKTNMPLGAIGAEEKEKLLHLEDELHQRVINQKDAIAAIANAIRRARAAMSDSKRPIGTFLFLGPTGVGKTETAKSLAAVYFGNADAMVRFDMTEYQSEEGLTRLIGSATANQQGILANTLRSAPYAVVLLDEFEKSHAKVQDLFLQILDEGFFTDAFGERVSMRNCIIIATSNAGSVYILDALQKKIPVADMQTGVISFIQSNGIFKPELLNRFDSVIVFTPLGPEELKQVATLMLKDLATRLKKQNLDLKITDELVSAVATGGYSATFGARPMRRFIQDRIEKVIADRIIAGSLKDGDSITLTAADLNGQ